MSKTKCPACNRTFDDDFKRYVIGSVTNTLKFAAHLGLRIGGGALGAAFGLGHKQVARAGGRAGKELAEAIGCGEKDLTGWRHKCPYCGHQWG